MSASDVTSKAFQIVSSMEDPIEDARTFAYGISILASEAIKDDEKLGALLMRIGWQIRDNCTQLEERRGELFKLLHPSRDHFEKEGWPS